MKEHYAEHDNVVRIEALKHVGEGKILDIGCGLGRYMEKLKGDVHGIDINDEALHICQQKGLNVKYGDAQKIPYPDNTFDYIICFEVLEHLEDPDLAIREIHRVLKDGGKAVITTPNTSIFHQQHKQNPNHIQFFRLEDIDRMFIRYKTELYGIFPPRGYSLFHFVTTNTKLIKHFTPNFIVVMTK